MPEIKRMYEENGACFDGTKSVAEAGGVDDDGFSPSVAVPPPTTTAFEDTTATTTTTTAMRHSMEDASATMEAELQQQLAFDMEQHCYNNNNNSSSSNHLMHEVIQDSNLVVSYEMQDIGFNHHHHHPLHHQDDQMLLQQVELQNGHHNFNPAYPPTPDLLNLFHLPRCTPSSLLPNSSISFTNPDSSAAASSASGILYDPLFHLNLPPQPPVFRELLQSLPHGYSLPASRVGSFFGGVDERETSGVAYQDGDDRQFDNGVLKFTRDLPCIGKSRDRKGTKHFATEKERRESLNAKFDALKKLVPNPTKSDRASVVGDAIEYIKELLRTVNELKILVDQKRCGREKRKRQKTGDDSTGDVESTNVKPDPDQSYNGSLRSSWLQRKSKDTEVDVRIIDDEVTIKLVQRKKINCLLLVSKILDELQLDLHHVAGGHVGDYYSFLFNTKIYEGSSVYASAIANKLIEAVDRQYATMSPASRL